MIKRQVNPAKVIFETLKLSRMGTVRAVRQEKCFDGL